MTKHIFPALLMILTAACGGGGSARPVPPDSVMPVTAERAADLSRLPAGDVRASIGFARVTADAEVAALTERHGARVYEVWLMVGQSASTFEVPDRLAPAAAIAEARRVSAERARQWPCMLLPRMSVRLRERGTRPAPGDRDPGPRMMLSELEAARAAPARLLRGEPAVYGLKVVATAEALRAIQRDPRVRSVTPEIAGLVPGPQPPEGFDETGRAIVPEVEAMQAEEVRRRLDRYAAEGLPECRESLRNQATDEATVRIEPGAVVDGVAFGVRTRVDSLREQEAGIGPTRVQATITLENRTGRPVEVPVLGCTEGMRIYRDPARAQLAVPVGGGQCMQDPYVIRLAPGERREVQTGTSADVLASRSLPMGRYYLSATFRLRERTLEIPAGDVVMRSGLEALRYPVRLTVRGGELSARANVVNTGRAPLALEYGECALLLRAYRTADRSGPPAWRSEHRGPAGGGLGYACIAIGYSNTIAPGDSLRRPFELRVPLIEVLGDSLPDGRYWFTASIELNFGRTPEVPAGDAVLAVARAPMQSQRMSGVMRFGAQTAALGGGVVATVTGTLVNADGAVERFSDACPVVLYAYRSRADRDAAPRAGAPVWVSHRECPPGEVEHTLSRGERRTWQVRAAARDILGASLPPGRYFFAVAVNHESRRVMLAAGEATLTR